VSPRPAPTKHPCIEEKSEREQAWPEEEEEVEEVEEVEKVEEQDVQFDLDSGQPMDGSEDEDRGVAGEQMEHLEHLKKKRYPLDLDTDLRVEGNEGDVGAMVVGQEEEQEEQELDIYELELDSDQPMEGFETDDGGLKEEHNDQRTTGFNDMGGQALKLAEIDDELDKEHSGFGLVTDGDTGTPVEMTAAPQGQIKPLTAPVPSRPRFSASPDPILHTPRTPTAHHSQHSHHSPPSQSMEPSRSIPIPSQSPSPVVVPADPALEQFRTARTFRTRTKLQLQPYTSERQLYEAALRRGGLKHAKRPIPTEQESIPNEILPVNEERDAQSSGSEADEQPERIVIGGTPPLAKLFDLVDADFDEYFLRFGRAAEEEDEEAMDALQGIARERLRAAKEARRKARDSRKAEKAFANLMRGREESAEAGVEGVDRQVSSSRV
jgi:hypothetical protein